MSEKAIIASVRESSSSSRSPPPPNDGFFSWIQDEESKKTSISKARTIPWMGLTALGGSVLTAILSFVLLFIVDGEKVWPKTGVYKVMQPASWLSALISANSIFLHIALTEGVTTAWWFKATRQHATIQDLHQVWATGTSASNALKNMRRLNYVSLATIFVAIIPLNGFLLQGALSTPVHTLNNTEIIPIPMVKQLQQGYSGRTALGGDGVDSSRSVWPTVFQQVQNTGGSSYSQYAYFGNYDYSYRADETPILNKGLYHDAHNDNQAVWQATVPGAGFEYSCTKSTVAFDMFPHNDSQTYNGTMFDLRLLWDKADPNTMYLDTYWKDKMECQGDYQVRNCTIRAATVEYPVQVQLNVSSAVAGPYYSLQPGTNRTHDRVVHTLVPYENEGLNGNTTYGGFASLFSLWYGGSITLHNYSQSTGGYRNTNGAFALSLIPNYMNYFSNQAPYVCNASVGWPLQTLSYFQAFNAPKEVTDAENGWYGYPNFNADVTDVVLEQFRQSMFLASVYSGSQWYTNDYVPVPQQLFDDDGNPSSWWLPSVQQTDYVQNVTATRFISSPVYQVRWYLWGSSLALTYVIVIIILPTFWGFWVLVRKPTMSPVDVARAFNAPLVTGEESVMKLRVDQLLREVGGRNIHRLPE